VEIFKVKFNMKLAITIRTGAATAERPEEIQKAREKETQKVSATRNAYGQRHSESTRVQGRVCACEKE
jgi:hypothetical protein